MAMMKDDSGSAVVQVMIVSIGAMLVVGMALFAKTAVGTVKKVMADIAGPQIADGSGRNSFVNPLMESIPNPLGSNFSNQGDNGHSQSNAFPAPSPQLTPFAPQTNSLESRLFAPQGTPAMPLGPTFPIPVSPRLSSAVDRISASASTEPRLIDGRVVRNSDGDVVPVYPGHCSHAVFQQLADAGIVMKPVDGRLRPGYAKDAGPHLEANGFARIEHYDPRKPLKGDIAVVPPYPGDTSNQGNGSGHISIFDGNQWVSDAKQGRSTFNPYRNRGVADKEVLFYRNGWGTPSLE